MDITSNSSSSSSKSARIIYLILRVIVFVFLLIALILMFTNKFDKSDAAFRSDTDSDDTSINYSYVYAFRYTTVTMIIGFVYNQLQMGLSIFRLISGKNALRGNIECLFDFFGDKIISYILLSGSAAAFSASMELKRLFHKEGYDVLNSYFKQANASAAVLLMASLFTAIASIFSSFALPKNLI